MDSSYEENNVKRATRVSPIKIVDSSDDEIKDKGEKRENPITIVNSSDDERKVVVSREEEVNEKDDEDDLLILDVNEADVEGMSIGEEEERDEEIEQPNPIDSEPSNICSTAADHSDRKAKKKKKKHRKIKGSKSKKAKGNNVKVKENGIEKECQEFGGLSPRFSSEDEEEKVHAEIRAKRRKLSRNKQKEKQKVALDFGCELSEDRSILTEGTVNSLGNYCPRMLAGLNCQEKECSWTHFMMPADAAGQFKKIIHFRPLGDVLQFFCYFTNLKIQGELIHAAQVKLKDLGEEFPDIKAKDVAREVFEEMFKNMQILDLSLKHCMEMIDISVGIYDVKDGQGNLIQLFNKIHLLLRDSGSHKDETRKLLKWALTHLYLASVERGLALSTEFYNDLTTMLSRQKNVDKLIEVLFYTSLLPTLSPSLVSLADILKLSTSFRENLLSNHSNLVLLAKTLSRLPSEDWLKLHNMIDIKPGLGLLIIQLEHADPDSVFKFYQSLPEMEGLEIPEVTPPLDCSLQLWISGRVEDGDWAQLAKRFCSISPSEPEVLADVSENLVLSISVLESELIKAAFQTGVDMVLEKRGGESVHKLFWTQVGLGLLLYLVSKSEWSTASQLIKDLTARLTIDWLKMKPPAINTFADIDRGMVALFVLEVLLNTRQKDELVKYLKLWDFLSCLQSETATGKRDAIFRNVLEFLISQDGPKHLETLIRLMEVMAGSMKVDSSPDKKKQEDIYNKIMMMMINACMPGSRLFAKYKLARDCQFQLEDGVTRGLVMLLANKRNNMIKAASQVYETGIKWGVYWPQRNKRPLTLRLSSSLTLEEMTIIIQDYLRIIGRDLHTDQSFNIFINVEEFSAPDTSGVTVLNRVSKKRKDALFRVDTVLDGRPPMRLNREGSVPFIEGQLVKLYLGKNY